MDPVLVVLQEKQLERKHIDRVCELFERAEARDVHMAFDMLMRLQRYRSETQSWSFRLLSSYDFDGPSNQFELDLARKVGAKAQTLLHTMEKWRVPELKAKVSRLPQYSDWGTVLTSLVLRIASSYASVEHSLRLAVSRATLIRIHCEMDKLDTEDDGMLPRERYRRFVKELLGDLEESSMGPEREKMFRTVTDLREMFRSFKKERDPDSQPSEFPSRGTGSSSSAGSAGSSSSRASSVSTADTEYSSDRYTDYRGTPGTAATGAGAGAGAVASQHSLTSIDVMKAFDRARTEETVRGAMTRTTLPLRDQRPAAGQLGPRGGAETPKAVNVQMVGGRMMVQQEGKMLDMQEWLDAANGLKVNRPPLYSRGVSSRVQAPNIASSGFLNALKRGW